MVLDSLLRYLASHGQHTRAQRPRHRAGHSQLYRPLTELLEGRLPLGDTALGVLAAASLLPTPAVAWPESSRHPTRLLSEPEASAKDTATFAHASDSDHEVLAAALADPVSQPARRPLANPFHTAGRSAFRPTATDSTDIRSLSMPAPQEPPSPAGVSHATPAVPAIGTHADGTLFAILASLQQSTVPTTTDVTPTQHAQVKENFGKLPLSFEENVGQTDDSVHFFARGPGYGLFLTSTEAVMALHQESGVRSQEAETADTRARSASEGVLPSTVVRMQLVGANTTPAVTGRAQQPGIVNYFLGNDWSKWRTNIHTYARVEYDEVYPGIDLVWYGSQQQLEYDFVVSPGADPSAIRLNFTGTDRIVLDAAGDLVFTAGDQELRQHKPFAYQEVNGTRQEVASRFVLEGQQVRFAVAAYDAARPLVIDPVLSYSTYVGGGDYDFGYGIAVDAAGSAYIAGRTLSTVFPTVNPFQPTYGGGDGDAFVTKLAADGATLVYSTYLGGRGTEQGSGVAVDANGNAYVTGFTDSTNFPTANAFQPTIGGSGDAFVTTLAANGAGLVYSTYLGGSGFDIGDGIAVNAAGNAYVTGSTTSTNFPTANPFQPALGGALDAFVTKLHAAGASLVYSTYLGGSSADPAKGIAVDADGNAHVTGWTESPNFPTVNALQPTWGGNYDAFVTKLAGDGTALVYSTYLGGSRDDHGQGIAVDAAGNAHVTGDTSSTNFPTVNAFQPTLGGGFDAFVTKLAADGASLVYSTYLGGSGNEDRGFGIAVDVADNAYVTGWANSTSFPTANPFQPALGGFRDAFVTKLDAAGASLVYSSYLGGSNTDWGLAIAVDAAGNAYVTGTTQSLNFPTTPGAFDRTCGTDGQCNYDGYGYYDDAFVTRIGSSPVAYYYVYPDSGQVQAGVPMDLYVFALDAGFNIIPDYTGEIVFWSTDPEATTPVYYQFQRSDRGIAYFPGGLTFRTTGTQELYVFDWPGIAVFGYAAYEVQG